MLRKLMARLGALVRRRDIERELDDELRFHLEMQEQANLQAGMSPEVARRAAAIGMGGLDQTKETVREVRAVWLDSFWQDLRYGARLLRRNPGVTAVVVLALGLGIGVNVAVFSVVNMLMLRPLPVRDPGRLVVPATTVRGDGLPEELSWRDIQDYREVSDVFEDLTGYMPELVGLGLRDRAERVTACYVPGNYFTLLGLEPGLGRLFLPDEGLVAGRDPVLVLSHGYWQRRFGGDPSIVGSTVRVDGHSFTVVGVAPEGFHGTYAFVDMQIYLPLGMAALDADYRDIMTNRGSRVLHAIGRLKDGLGMEQARAALQVVARGLASQYPETNKETGIRLFWENQARPEEDSADGGPLIASFFLGLVAVVLLVASVNVANILLVRATVRQKELAIRGALGAPRNRIVRQLLTESGLLALLGGGAGIVLGRWTSRLLASMLPSGDLPIHMDLGFDWRVFAYVTAIALLSGLAAGLAPALRVSRSGLGSPASLGSRAPGAGSGRRLRDLLVVAQVAGSLLLLVAAGLFARSLANAESVDLGFRPAGVMNFSLDPGQQGLDETRTKALYRELLARVRSLPGVESASLAHSIPLGYYNVGERIVAEGQVLAPEDRGLGTSFNVVDAEYPLTMGMRLTRGRWFTATEDESGRAVAVVNENLASRLWPEQDPLGRRFQRRSGEGPWYEVIGVTSNGKYNYLFETPSPFFYLPHGQDYRSQRALHVRSPLEPAAVAASVRQTLHGLAPGLPVYDVMTMQESLGGGNGYFLVKLGAVLATMLGVIGAVLALVGLYGVVAYAASQRTHEIGIRVALGAGRRQIVGMVAGHGLGLSLVGGAVGLVAALAGSRLIAWMLFSVTPYDPLTYLGVCVLLAGVALVACVVPATRALRVDPSVALRCE